MKKGDLAQRTAEVTNATFGVDTELVDFDGQTSGFSTRCRSWDSWQQRTWKKAWPRSSTTCAEWSLGMSDHAAVRFPRLPITRCRTCRSPVLANVWDVGEVPLPRFQADSTKPARLELEVCDPDPSSRGLVQVMDRARALPCAVVVGVGGEVRTLEQVLSVVSSHA